jgi:DNA-binding response OmpR family regulator
MRSWIDSKRTYNTELVTLEGSLSLTSPISANSKPHPKILVVDDDKDTSMFFQTCLEDEGFCVTVYNNSKEALSNFKPDYYDLAILDIRMPEMNGFELFYELKKKDSRIRSCFITAFEEYYGYLMTLFPNLDVKCFIKKPVSAKDLISRVMSEIITNN